MKRRGNLTFGVVNRVKSIATLLLIVASMNGVFAQAPTCDPSVPFFTIDLTGNPDSVWVSPAHSRVDHCCGVTGSDRCTSFEITLDSNTAAISFNIEDGAIPPGALFYQVGCGPQTVAGESFCISGVGPHYVTFCKPGNNTNTYSVTSIAKPTFPQDDSVRVGCSQELRVFGLDDSLTAWTSIAPGSKGQYDGLLSCTACASPVFTPLSATPSFIDYEVCGFPLADDCGFNVTVCDTVRVYIFDALSATVNPNPANFCVGGSVTLTATASGGDGNYSYTWVDGSSNVIGTNSSVSVNSVDTYSVTIDDGLSSGSCPGYVVDVPVTIGDIVITANQIDDADCNGASTGSIDLNVAGGQSPYTYNWSNGATTEDLSNVPAGTYNVTVSDVNGCTSTNSFTVSQPVSAVSVSLNSVTDATCAGFNDGAVDINVSGGTPGYTYAWTGGATTQDISGVAAGNYTVTVTDANGCTATFSQTIGQPSNLSVGLSSPQYVGEYNVTCNGATDGAINSSVFGGTPGYTYAWSNGATTANLSGLGAGTYNVTVTDANGCTAFSSVNLQEPPVLTAAATAATYVGGDNVSCNGATDGSVDLTVTGGTLNYGFNWSNGATTEDLSNVGAGTYMVTVTDTNGCTATTSITLTEPAILTASATAATYVGGNNVSCNGATDGSIDLTVGGGHTAYTYNWSTGATTQDLSGIGAGTYDVTVTDVNGCTATASITLTEPAALSLSTTVTDATTNGGSEGAIDLSVSGGIASYTYSWSSGATTQDISGLPAGSYCVTVTDANGCTASTCATVNEPSCVNLLINSVDSENVSCNGFDDGAITVNASTSFPPIQYSINGGTTFSASNSFTGLAPGSYNIVITDAVNCTTSLGTPVVITEPATLTASATAFTYVGGDNVSCNGASDGSVDLTVGGGTTAYTYSWSNGATTQDLSGIAAGAYTVTVTDANGCTASTSITLTAPAALTVSATAATYVGGNNVSCNGATDGSIDLTVGGGHAVYTYNWSTGATTQDLSGIGAGTYDVTVTDVNGCTATASITLTEPAVLTASATAATYVGGNNVSCNGATDGSIDLTVGGGITAYSYNWSTGATTEDLSGVSAGTYNVTVTDANGCTATTSITLTEPAVLTASASGSNISCNGFSDGDVDLTVSGGITTYTYNWSNGATTQDLTGVPAGTYTVTVTDANGCTATASATLTQADQLTASATAFTYVGGDNVSCNGATDGSVDLTIAGGTPGFTYNWSNGATTEDLSGIGAGTYNVTVTDANGCTAATSITLTEPAELTASATAFTYVGGDNISCNGATDGSVDLTVSGGHTTYTYSWSNGATTQDLSGIGAGTYNVTVTDANGCTAATSITLTEPAELTASATAATYVGGNNVSCNGATDGSVDLTVSGGHTAYTYSWSNGATTQDLSGIGAGTYDVTVTDANGCTAATSITLTEPAVLVVSTTGDDPTCNGFNNGSIDLTISGGIPTYAYAWSNGSSSQDLNGVGAGTYTVTVTDANGCTATSSITLDEPTVLTASATGTNISCNGFADGEIDLTVGGGTPGYTYNWSNGVGTEDQTGLTAGTYTVTVTDAQGCTATTSITLTEPDVLTGDAVITSPFTFNDPICGTNSTIIDGQNPQIGNVSPITPNPYPQCDPGVPFFSIDLTGSPDSTWVSALFSRAGNCCGTSNPDRCVTFEVTLDPNSIGIILSVSAGAEPPGALFWELNCAGQNSLDSLVCLNGVGPHYVTFCKPGNNANAYKISALSGARFPEDDSTRVGCSETYNLYGFASGGLSWNSINPGTNGQYNNYLSCTNCPNPSFSPDANAPAFIDYEICGFAACSNVPVCDTFRVFILDSLPDADGYVSCNGEEDAAATVDNLAGGTPPFTFIWSNGATTQTITDLAPGDYTVTITDANGCTFTDAVTIGEPPLLEVGIIGEELTCNNSGDGFARAVVTGGSLPYSYLWSTGTVNDTIFNVNAGTYSVTVTDGNGCTAEATVTLTEPNTLDATLTPLEYVGGDNVSCNGATDGSIDLSVTGGTTPYTYIWSNGATTEDLTGLGAGTYTVTVTDSNSCTTTATITLTEPDVLDASATAATYVGGNNVSCNGAADGSVDLSVTGGHTPYDFIWSNGATTEDLTGLTAGTYTVTVTDTNGCVATESITLTEPDAIVLSTTVTDVTTNAGSDGAVDLTVSGGIPTYTYIWSNGATTQDISGVPAGNYCVTVTDANGCTESTCANVSEPACDSLLINNVDVENVSCFGFDDGSITIDASTLNPPIMYSIDGGTTFVASNTFSGLAPGSYDVYITDAVNCTTEYNVPVVITQPDTLTASVTATTYVGGNNVSCNGATDGSIDLTVAGGTTAYTYSWSNGAVTQDLTGLGAGTYAVTVTDANGCTATASITLTEPTVLTVSTSSPTFIGGNNVSCNAASDGAVNTSVAGGITTYTYAWSNGATTPILVNVAAGTYSVTVTDANGCTATSSITLTEPDVLTASATSFEYIGGNNISCNGAADGSIDLTVAGGIPGYDFNWSNGATTEDLSGLTAGTYSVTVTDTNGCTTTASITLTEPDALTASATGTDISCNGFADGTVDLTVGGGITPYSYDWSNADTTQDLSGVTAGTYTVTVTDVNGCTATASITLTEPDVLSASVTGTDISCNGFADGAVDLTVTGGTTPYDYDWSNGDTTQDLSGVTAGTYTVTVTDAQGCTTTASITLTEPDVLSASVTGTDISCNGFADGTVDLTVTGGTTPYDYDWSNGDTTQDLSGLTAGTYTVTVTDAQGCTATATITLTEPNVLTLSTQVTNLSCFEDGSGAVDLTVTGGTTPYVYNWSNGAATEDLSGLSAGTYDVTVTDAQGCTATTSATVTQPDRLVATVTGTDISCNGFADGAVDLTVSGGTTPYGYNWSNGATTQDLSGVTAGTYDVTVTDANGCTATASITLTEPDALVASATGTDVSCNNASDGDIDLTVIGGTTPYEYDWSTGDTTQDLTGLPTGTYTVTVTDAQGCTTTETITLTQPAVLTLSTTTEDVTCFGDADGAVDLTVSGGTTPYVYDWSNGDTTQDLSGLSGGTYDVTVTDAQGCTASTSATIAEPDSLIATSSDNEDVSCFGAADGIAYVNATGGTTPYTYLWSNGATTRANTGLSGGTYIVTVTDANGCTDTASAVIDEPDTLIATATSTNLSCFEAGDGSIDVTVIGGTPAYEYEWSNGAVTQDLSGLSAGTYTLTVTDDNGCTDTVSVTITQPDSLTLSTQVTDVTCSEAGNGAIDLAVAGGTAPYDYDWSNGAVTQDLTALGGGTYTVTVTDANGCTATITATVDEPAELVGTVVDVTDVSCNGGADGAIDIDVTGGTTPYGYNWSNGAATQDISGLTAGTYTVTITDANGCSTLISATVNEPDALVATTTTTDASCNGVNDGAIDLTVTGGTTPYGYNWSTGDTTQDLTGLAAGTYDVTVTDANGCTTTASATITQPDSLMVSGVPFIYSGDFGVSCNGASDGSIDLTVVGGTQPYDYDWSNGDTTQDISGLSAGAYTVIVTDANGCVDTDTFNLTEPQLLTVTPTVEDVSCYGLNDGSINLSVSGGVPQYTFNWSNGDSTRNISGLAPGTYDVTVTDVNGCTATTSGTVNEPDSLVATAVNVDNVSCFNGNDGAIDVEVTGGVTPYEYYWNTGDTTQDLSGIAAGTYILEVFDLNECLDSVVVTITEPDTLVATAANITSVSCNGVNDGAIDITVTGGTPNYEFLWSNGATTEDISGLTAGTYCVTVTDANGCATDSTCFEVIEPDELTVNIEVVDTVLCYNDLTGDLLADPQGGTPAYEYLWSTQAVTDQIGGLPAGTYSVTVTDANGCTAESNALTLTNPDSIVINGTVIDESCQLQDGSIDYEVNGAVGIFTESWRDGVLPLPNNFQPVALDSGEYVIVVTDSRGCTGQSTFEVNGPGFCNDKPVAVDDTATVAGGGTVNIPVLDNDFDPNNDNIFISDIIDDPDHGSVTINNDGTVDYTPDEGFVGVDTFTYVVCDDGIPSMCDTAIVVITVIPEEIPDFFIPNVLTPNGDGANDDFFIEGLGLFPERKLKIFNRWGGEVWSSDFYENNWGGTNQDGENVPDGTYFYILEIVNLDGVEANYSGYVVVYR